MKKVLTLVIAAMAFCLTGFARADSVTYSASYSGLTDVTNQTIAVNQFNSSLGTLQSATFVLGATMNTSMFAANDGDFYAGWDKMEYSLSLTGDAPYSGIAISAVAAPVRVVGTGTPDESFSFSERQHIVTGINPSLWTFAGPTLTATQTFAQGALAAFAGSGNLNFFLTTQNYDAFSVAGTQTGGSPAPSQGLHTNIISDVSVTYTYTTPVPEPETYAMFMAGLGLMGFMARRRRNGQA